MNEKNIIGKIKEKEAEILADIETKGEAEALEALNSLAGIIREGLKKEVEK